ncbi:TetR/AcrR family transcriptional regulator [Sphingomonas sp. SUN019]|uniref:TetR/AcrR family transcriptional regulator n=1 Tax=Sphingomonas sp. SUN019 TaxID=2937788 RepID=UPI002164C7C8|nr:TetR/AcrR family transcriptional regulator [Sphingomonas sp. SUN019]UVO51024.1 TetR/AcrR family transcriptional regulator [Sphingomonas sp. SUN019]
MTTAAAPSKAVPKKRGKGRPVSGENDVGRERLLMATEKLLRTLPPARVTISRIAKEANADPALVRYYFGNRAALLVAVVDRVTAHAQRNVHLKDEPSVALASHIARTVQLVRRAPFLHRLLLEELAEDGTEESRARVRDMNLDLVEFYRALLRADGGGELVETDPLFLYVAVLGASDFFVSAEPLIRELVPESTDMERLTTDFQMFLGKLVLDGLRKR